MSKIKETINLHEQQSAENGTHTRFLSRRDKNKRMKMNEMERLLKEVGSELDKALMEEDKLRRTL